jgi:hypothetical protein
MARFTVENSREMAARSAVVRRANRDAAKEALPQLPQNPLPTAAAADEYVLSRVARARAQIARLDVLFEKSDSAQELDRICAALARLHEVERQLSGRPMPPSYRAREAPLPPRRNGQSREVLLGGVETQ